jgi:non-heme chloroperoxidase
MVERIAMGELTVLRCRPATELRPPLLFIHGFVVTGDLFADMMERFARRGHSCYAVNLRGRAASRPGTDVGNASMQDFADDAAEVARALDRPVVVGHSMGGLVAQMVAERGLARALVLFAPAPPRGIPLITWRLAVAQIPYLPAILAARPVRPIPAVLGWLSFNRLTPAQRQELSATAVPDSGRAARQMAFGGIPVARERVTVPTLVIGGDDDRFIPLTVVSRVAQRYGATLRVAPGRGHMLILEHRWEELTGWVEEWLDASIPENPS